VTEEASAKVKRGDFLHLPFIGGTNVNEGNSFSTTLLGLRLSGTAENSAFDNFINHLVIDPTTVTTDVLNEFQQLFPANDSSLGAPFNTGDSLFDRGAAWYTDIMFLSPRRLFFQNGAALQPMFAYYFTEFIPGNNPTLGVAHASELALLFGPVPPVASVETALSTQMRDFYINFINDLNPGPAWPAYNLKTKGVLQLMRDNITIIPDVWDTDKTDFINSARVLAEFQK